MTVMTAGGFAEPFTAAEVAALPNDDGRRYELVDGSLLVFREEPFTVDDVDAWPDDGRRHEVIDGVLVLTPGPRIPHGLMLGGLILALDKARPADIAIVPGAGYRASTTTQFVPDLFVCRRDQATGMYLTAAPLLVIEATSPSTARVDWGRKRDAYEARGVASYWLADPRVPSVTVLELRDGRYEEVVTVTGDEEVVVEQPFRVRLVPSELARG